VLHRRVVVDLGLRNPVVGEVQLVLLEGFVISVLAQEASLLQQM
jgi:hypothetical protein